MKGLSSRMTREQAIFFETMDDLNFEGYTELLILSYHEFITGFDFSEASDIDVHRRAKKVIKKYQQYWYSAVNFFDLRSEILEKLELDDAEWEYLDQKETEVISLLQESKQMEK
jgi:hypothetical protein